jgi:hypothetical protein
MVPNRRATRSGLTVRPPRPGAMQRPSIDPGFSPAVPAHVIAALGAALRPHPSIDPGFGRTDIGGMMRLPTPIGAAPQLISEHGGAPVAPTYAGPIHATPMQTPFHPGAAPAPAYNPVASHIATGDEEARAGFDAGNLNIAGEGAPLPAHAFAMALLQQQMQEALLRQQQMQRARYAAMQANGAPGFYT